jgi:F-type H+-transporting ATPase subunit c
MTGSIAAVGAGVVTLGAGVGIGWLASSAMSAIARQPEAAAKIQTSMLIAAALIEGVALFAAVVCLLSK